MTDLVRRLLRTPQGALGTGLVTPLDVPPEKFLVGH